MNGRRNFTDDTDEGALVPMGEALDAREVARLQRLVDSLLRHQGAVPKECPHCGTVVRVADVVVFDEDLGHGAKRKVILEDGTYTRHRRLGKNDFGEDIGCKGGC